MNRDSKVALLTLAGLLFLGACDDDATRPAGDTLSQQEAAALTQILMTRTFEAAGEGEPLARARGNPLRAAAVVDFENSVELTLGCPLGGTWSAARTISGTVDTEAGTVDLQFGLVQIPDACVVEPEEVDGTLTLTGAPDVTSSYAFSGNQSGAFEAAGGIVGALDWATGDRSGRCEVDLQFTGSGDGQGALSMSVAGRICQATISEQVSVTP
ncbi:MAG: hypothetical protein RQ751_05065 [Longimicrobiales bacterium]|nr:hypothetical protein [Longimicrobiales bacterium]